MDRGKVWCGKQDVRQSHEEGLGRQEGGGRAQMGLASGGKWGRGQVEGYPPCRQAPSSGRGKVKGSLQCFLE